MKKLIFVFLFFGCNGNNPPALQEANEVRLDPLIKKYILENVKEKNDIKNNAFIFIYPSFCGACNDSIMTLINNNCLKSFYPYYIYPSNDSLNSYVKKYSKGITKFMDAYEMGRHGLEAAHNQIFLFRDTTCIYYAKLSSETVPEVRKELAVIESNAQ